MAQIVRDSYPIRPGAETARLIVVGSVHNTSFYRGPIMNALAQGSVQGLQNFLVFCAVLSFIVLAAGCAVLYRRARR